MIPTIQYSGKGKTIQTVKRSVVASGLWEGKMSKWNTGDFLGESGYFVEYGNGRCMTLNIC